MIGFQPEKLMDYEMNRAEAERMGNRAPGIAPHGIYRCAEEDSWISIVVASDDEWVRLCSAIGRDELARDDRFATASARKGHEDALDEKVEGWTLQRSKLEAMNALQGVGVGGRGDIYERGPISRRTPGGSGVLYVGRAPGAGSGEDAGAALEDVGDAGWR